MKISKIMLAAIAFAVVSNGYGSDEWSDFANKMRVAYENGDVNQLERLKEQDKKGFLNLNDLGEPFSQYGGILDKWDKMIADASKNKSYNRIKDAYQPEGPSIDERLINARDGLERRQSYLDLKGLKNSDQLPEPTMPRESTKILKSLLNDAFEEMGRLHTLCEKHDIDDNNLIISTPLEYKLLRAWNQNLAEMKFNRKIDAGKWMSSPERYSKDIEIIATLNGELSTLLADNGIDPRQ